MSQPSDYVVSGAGARVPEGDGPSVDGMRLALEVAQIGSWDWDLASGAQVWSPELERLFGFTPGRGRYTADAFYQLVHPDDLPRIRAWAEQAVAEGRADIEDTFRVIRPDGTLAWFVSRTRLYRDAHGQVTRMVGVNMDVTAHRRVEEQLREAEGRRARERERDIKRREKLLALGERLAASRDAAAVARALVEEGFEVYGPVACAIALLREDGELELVALHGYPEHNVIPRAGDVVSADTPFGEVARTGQSIWLDSGEEVSARYPHLAAIQAQHGFAATAVLPLRGGGRLLGVMGFRYPAGVVPDAEERYFATLIAERLANALERVRLLATLRASEERFRRLVEATSQVVWVRDAAGEFAVPQAGWERFTGQPFAAYAGWGWLDAVHPEDREACRAAWAGALEARAVCETEYRLRRADGAYRWVVSTGVPVFAPDGAPREWVGTEIDSTERHAAEEALRESHELLGAALDAGRLGAWEWKVAQDSVTWTDRIYSFHGLAPGTFGGTVEDFGRLVHPEDAAMVQAALGRSLAERAPYELEFRTVRPDGEVRWLFTRAEVFADETGAPARMIGITQDVTERRRAEVEARQLAAIIEATPDFVAIGGLTGEVRYINRAGRQMLGLPVDGPLSAYGWADLTPPAVMERTRAEWLPAALRDGAARGEGGLRTLDGREIPTSFVLLAHRGADGRVESLSTVARDIGERQRAEEALRASEARLAAFLQHSPGSVFIKDAQGRYVLVNESFLAQAGLSAGQVIGRRDEELFTPELASLFLAEDDEVRRAGAGRRFEETFVYGGRRYTFLSHKFPLPGGDIGCVGIDITDQKEVEERLRQLNLASVAINAAATREEVLRAMTRESRGLIGAHQAAARVVDEQGHALSDVSLSPRYAAWQGGGPEADGLAALVCRTNTPMRLTRAELEAHPAYRRPGAEAIGRPPLQGWLAAPLVGRAGRNLGLIQLAEKYAGEFSADDEALLVQLAQIAAVALEKQALYAQERAARAQAEEASRLKDEFLATVSHELRTPLTAFLGYAELLQRRKRDEAYVARAVEKMVQSARAQAALIEDLLDVSRIVSGKLRIEPAPLALDQVVLAALDTVRPTIDAKGLHVRAELDPAAGAVLGDASRLQQVVWNLLSNAAKFTPPGGCVGVRLARVGDSAALSVSDSGQGITSEFLPYVFDRFRQADSSSQRPFGGLGLGLAIVRHLVELHGGTVEAQSEGPGLGATFIVRLPLSAASAAGQAGASGPLAAEGAGAPLSGVRVLLVDDQPAILELLAELLAADGATVRACATAREGLALVRAWRPDVLVSDIAMPGEDGYWLVEQVRALPPEEGGATPTVALTAYMRVEDRLRVLAAGFEQYVPKPVDTDELRDVILRLVAGEAGR